MLKLNQINKYYNPGSVNEICLFEDFNLSVKKGEFISIVGSNGSGKTSLLNIICGNLELDSGSIIVKEKDITKEKDYIRCKNIGRVYQDPSKGTCPSMTILENMAIADNKGKKFLFRPGVEKNKIEKYRTILKKLNLGLEDKLDTKVEALSGGQRQTLALIMATMTPIEFLLLDEHTAALDPKTAEHVMEITRQIVEEKKLTTIMVTHNLRYAVDYGTRLIMMHQGEIVMERSGQEKKLCKVEDILKTFNEISIECGN